MTQNKNIILNPACRYEKGAWSECTTGQMTRSDKLKTTTDTTCQTTRVVTKNCNQGKNKGEKNPNKERPGKNGNKEKGVVTSTS